MGVCLVVGDCIRPWPLLLHEIVLHLQDSSCTGWCAFCITFRCLACGGPPAGSHAPAYFPALIAYGVCLEVVGLPCSWGSAELGESCFEVVDHPTVSCRHRCCHCCRATGHRTGPGPAHGPRVFCGWAQAWAPVLCPMSYVLCPVSCVLCPMSYGIDPMS